MNKPIAININFDSLNENLGFPKGYKDVSYFGVFDRFLKFSNEYNFKYSIYIIGKDLENPEINTRVKEWAQMGHEIGNHSYSHCLNIGGLAKEDLHDEIMRSHDLIHKCTGKAPKGFICPGWSTSKKVLGVLIENNYLYDTSLFPSPVIYPAVIKNAINHLGRPQKFKEIISRRDYAFSFTKPISPFFADEDFNETTLSNERKIVILPIPVRRRFTAAIWHTLLFMFNKKRGMKTISRFTAEHDYFYYLLHPADLIEKADLGFNQNHTIERMNIDLKTKEQMLKDVFDIFKNAKRPIVTMEQMALNFIEEQKLKSKSVNANA